MLWAGCRGIEDADRYIDKRHAFFFIMSHSLIKITEINCENAVISAPPLAFEVPVHENEESIIKKHPPKRLRRLEEQQQDPKDLTHQLIDEKQSVAEARRKEILDQRIRSAAKQRMPLDRKFLRSEAFSQEVRKSLVGSGVFQGNLLKEKLRVELGYGKFKST